MSSKDNKESLLQAMLAKERKTPLNDQKLADILNISRANVIELRQKLNIPSSDKRLNAILKPEIAAILKDSPELSVRGLHSELQKRGYTASVSIVYQITKQIEQQISDIKTYDFYETEEAISAVHGFEQLLGHDESLLRQVNNAKSAVLYPPNGLNTLIVGETGVGKSFFAKCMFEFAISNKIMKPNRFVQFNCADYANNPDLLCSQLFGHVKGAYTGADRDKFGLVAQAHKGMLFLDEVHRLPAEGQEMLFSIIDNGHYRRMGESGAPHKVQIMIVAATTENINSVLLATFRRRVPMLIELPNYSSRSINERMSFIKMFASKESARIQKNIELSYEACCALVSYTPLYNIGQLESDIKVSIAKAYLQFVITGNKTVHVTLDMLPPHIIQAWREYGVGNMELQGILPNRLVVSGNHFLEDLADERADIYQYIDSTRKELLSGNLDASGMQQRLSDKVENKIKEFISQNSFGWETNTQYYTGVDKRIQDVIEKFIHYAGKKIADSEKDLQTLRYSLGFHLKSMLEQLQNGLEIIHPNYAKIQEENPEMYALASELVKQIEKSLNMAIPEDEVGYISNYLTVAGNYNSHLDDHVGIVIACHGEVASGMLNAATHFVGENHAISIDMPLNVSPLKIYQQIRDAVISADKGKGVLFLTDMGSLVTFGPEIERETGINVETMVRVDTMMLMGAIYWSANSKHSLDMVKEKIQSIQVIPEASNTKSQILCVSSQGQGKAEAAAAYVRDNFIGTDSSYMLVIDDAINVSIDNFVQKLDTDKKIAAIIGDKDMHTDISVPFFTMQTIGVGDGFEKLQHALNLPVRINLKWVLRNAIIYIDPPERTREGIIQKLCTNLYDEGFVTESFLCDIMEREEMVSTYVGSHMAIPHSIKFDNIISSQIGIVVYKEPINWMQFPVNVVCIMALRKNASQYFEQLYKRIIQNWDALLQADSSDEIQNLITRKT